MATRSYREQRQWPRVEINSPGTIVILHGLRIAKTIPCTVINVSEGGALLSLFAEITESEFYLEIDKFPEIRRSCSVVRRNGKTLGVRFH